MVPPCEKADGQSVKALFNFTGCGECGLGFCFWQLRSGLRETLLRTKHCVWWVANSVTTHCSKLCRFTAPRAILSRRNGKLFWKIRRVAACVNCKLLMAGLIPTARQTAT